MDPEMRLEVSRLLKISQTDNERAEKRLLKATGSLHLIVTLHHFDSLLIDAGQNLLARGNSSASLAALWGRLIQVLKEKER
jgi:hypothetical protein